MTTSLGLNAAEWDLIRNVFVRYPEIAGAIVFGSRAKGTAMPSSDIDVALEGVEDPLIVASVAAELDELPLPYRFDVKALASIQSQPLREHIARVGVRIYGS